MRTPATPREARAARFDAPRRGDSRRTAFAASLAIHVLLVGAFPVLLANFRRPQRPDEIEIVFYRPAAERREVRRPAPPLEPPARITRKEPDPAPPPRELPPPRRPPIESPPQVARVEPRPEPVEVRAPAPARAVEPPRPKVRTDVFETADKAAPARSEPRRQARPAGFATPDATAAPGKPDRTLRGSAKVGAFEVDPAPSEKPSTGSPDRRKVAATGFEAQTQVASRHDTPSRDRGAVKRTGFDIPPDGPAPPPHAASSGTVATGGFGDTVVVAPPRAGREKSAANPDTPVEILSKAAPVYTEKARELQVEGEVVLEVIFAAGGEMRVLGVVRGLGYGLDEAAIDAARKIEFKPARRDGQPVDYTATLRIVFQLA